MLKPENSFELCHQPKINPILNNVNANLPPNNSAPVGQQNTLVGYPCSRSLMKIRSCCIRSNDRWMDDVFRRFLGFFFIVIFLGLIVICSSFLYERFECGSLLCASKENLFWSNWSPWSECLGNSKISSRNRTCMNRLLRPQTGCLGPQSEFIKCTIKSRKTNRALNVWTEWSGWSPCSKTCKEPNQIPLQTRHRICPDSTSKNFDSCIGEKVEYKFCTWLKSCLKSSWSEWTILEPCQARYSKRCGPGIQTLQRKCLTKKPCVGTEKKIEFCWSQIGCPVDLQPPKDVELFSDGNGNFKLNWTIVPYGEIPVSVRIFFTMQNLSSSEIKTFSRDIALNYNNVKEYNYGTDINLSQYISNKSFSTLTVRLLTVNSHGNQSIFTDPISSAAKAVDGQWGSWSYWSDCSTNCADKIGSRTRTRECDSPSPKRGGKECQGLSEESLECTGVFEENCE